MSTTGITPRYKLHHALAVAMEEANVEPEDMALAIGKSLNTVYNYMAGRSTPGFETVVKWANTCNVPLSWFTDTVTTGYPWPELAVA